MARGRARLPLIHQTASKMLRGILWTVFIQEGLCWGHKTRETWPWPSGRLTRTFPGSLMNEQP